MSARSDIEKAFAMGFVVGASEAIRSVIDAQRMSNEQRKGLLPTYCPPPLIGELDLSGRDDRANAEVATILAELPGGSPGAHRV
jgi:hypothetical protein